MRPLTGIFVAAALATAFGGAWALAGPRAAVPEMAPATQQVTEVLVLKAERRLILKRGGEEIAAYDIALGFTPEGHKRREGDGRTPEGRYVIDWRNPQSAYHLSLHVSYPNAADRAAAAKSGEDPGGMIMIHGLPSGLGWLGAGHALRDWTAGCIAVNLRGDRGDLAPRA